MSLTESIEGTRVAAFQDKVLTEDERRGQLRELESLHSSLEQNAGYAIDITTWQLFTRAIGITAALAGNTPLGNALSAAEKGCDGVSNFMNAVNEKDKQEINGKLSLLRECMDDVKNRRSEIESTMQDLNRLVREIRSTQHDARKTIMRK